MSKRKASELETVIPENFHQLDNGRIVHKPGSDGQLHHYVMDKVPIKTAYFTDQKNMGDDSDEQKHKVYVDVKLIDPNDLAILREVDAALEAAAKLQDRTFCPMINETKGTLKIPITMKLTHRKKKAIISGQQYISGTFMLSSVYDYEARWYGINLIVPKNQKKATLGQITKPKVEKKPEPEPADEPTDEQDE